MSALIRPAKLADLDQIVDLSLEDARARNEADPGLWRIDAQARDKSHNAIKSALKTPNARIRQRWLVAEQDGALHGVVHSILVPVPPIYAGRFGPPGLIMEDCYIAPRAPRETRAELLKAAEADLIEAGALILVVSSVTGGDWETAISDAGYVRLTAYFTKTGLGAAHTRRDIRPAIETRPTRHCRGQCCASKYPQ